MTKEEFHIIESKLRDHYKESMFGMSIIKIIKRNFPKESEKLNKLGDAAIGGMPYLHNNSGILYLKLLEKLTFKNK